MSTTHLPPLPGTGVPKIHESIIIDSSTTNSGNANANSNANSNNLSIGIPPHRALAYISIFEDALDQLSVLGDITPEVVKTENKQLAEKIAKILLEQRSLQARYHDLILEQEQSRTVLNKTKYKETQNAISEVNNQLLLSSQTLARYLKTHPSVAQNLLKIQQERVSLQALLSRSIHELRDGRFESLVTTVEEEYKKRNALQHTINLENDALDTLKDLQRELSNEKKLIQDEVNDRNQVIQQLKDTIQEINALTASEQKYIKKEVKAHENSTRLQCQEKEARLYEEKQLLLQKIEQERLVHEKIVDFLHRQRDGLEKEIQDWMVKYEEDTESKANELEALKQKRSQDLDKFEELVASYETLEKTVDEDKQVRAKELEEFRLQQLRLTSVIKIQLWFRKIRAIRAQQASAKASTKGKGKGKKGKGKKK